jgi:hypothetical protein
MRRQAKPFTVEIKKSRKSGQEPASSSFLGLMELAETAPSPSPARAAPAEAERLFGRLADPGTRVSDKAGGRQAAETGRRQEPTRILPDLSHRPEPEPVVEPEPKPVRERRMSPRPRPAPLPVPEVVAPPLAAEPPAPRPAVKPRRPAAEPQVVMADAAPAANRPVAPIRRAMRQRHRRDPLGLLPGERWKRRLPPALR